MKKIIIYIFIFMFLFKNNAFAEMEPLENIISKISKDNIDLYELVHVYTRCSALYYSGGNGTSKQDADLREAGRKFTVAALFIIEKNQLKISNKRYENNLQNLTDEYLNEAEKIGVSIMEIKDTQICATLVKETIPSFIWNSETK